MPIAIMAVAVGSLLSGVSRESRAAADLTALPPVDLLTSENHEGITLLPPPPTLVPAVAADAAMQTAASDSVPEAKSVRPIFALYKDAHSTVKLPVWVIRYKGGCVPLLGAPNGGPTCAYQQWNVMVDATSGKFIVGFTP